MAEFLERDAAHAIAAIRANLVGLRSAPAHAENPEVVLAAIETRGGAEFEHAGPVLKAEFAFVVAAVGCDRASAEHAALAPAQWVALVTRVDVTQFIPSAASTVRILVAAVRAWPLSARHLSPSTRALIARVIRAQDAAIVVQDLVPRIEAIVAGVPADPYLVATIKAELLYSDGRVLRHRRVAPALKTHAPDLLWKLVTRSAVK